MSLLGSPEPPPGGPDGLLLGPRKPAEDPSSRISIVLNTYKNLGEIAIVQNTYKNLSKIAIVQNTYKNLCKIATVQNCIKLYKKYEELLPKSWGMLTSSFLIDNC